MNGHVWKKGDVFASFLAPFIQAISLSFPILDDEAFLIIFLLIHLMFIYFTVLVLLF